MKLDILSWDNLWHFLIGGAISAVFILLGHYFWAYSIPFGPFVAALVGFMREWGQHRTDVPQWTPHRITEASMWVVGAIVGDGIYLLILILR